MRDGRDDVFDTFRRKLREDFVGIQFDTGPFVPADRGSVVFRIRFGVTTRWLEHFVLGRALQVPYVHTALRECGVALFIALTVEIHV